MIDARAVSQELQEQLAGAARRGQEQARRAHQQVRKGQEVVAEVVKTLTLTAEALRPQLPTIKRPTLPAAALPRLPGADQLLASAHEIAGQVLAAQRKLADQIAQTAAPLLAEGAARLGQAAQTVSGREAGPDPLLDDSLLNDITVADIRAADVPVSEPAADVLVAVTDPAADALVTDAVVTETSATVTDPAAEVLATDIPAPDVPVTAIPATDADRAGTTSVPPSEAADPGGRRGTTPRKTVPRMSSAGAPGDGQGAAAKAAGQASSRTPKPRAAQGGAGGEKPATDD